MEVKILEICKVTPPLGSPTEDICLPLTFFDLLNFHLPAIEVLFFYETTAHHPHHVILSKLKHSLSLTLQQFLPVAGHLLWPHSSPNPIILYKNGNGVLFTVTESNADFYHLSSKKTRESKILHPLIADMEGSRTELPLMAFKITLFPNKGICIGINFHHSIFDSTSFTLFMNSWASFVKFGENSGLPQELTPVFDRYFIRKRYQELESLCLEFFKKLGIRSGKSWSPHRHKRLVGIVRSTFILSNSDVRTLKRDVTAQLEKNSQVLNVSTFAVTYAYVILCLTKLKPPKNNKINVFFAYDCKERLEPPLPKNYIGNCVGLCNTYFETEKLLGRDGMAVIVNFISKTMERVNAGGALKEAEEWLPDIFKLAADRESLKVFVAGSSRYDYQSIDFGWGKPRKTDIASIDGTGCVMFTEGGDENKGGIEVDLSLKECEIEKFSHLFHKSLSEMKQPIKASL